MGLSLFTDGYPVSEGNLLAILTWKTAGREQAAGQGCDFISLAQRWVTIFFPFPTYQWLHSTHPTLLYHKDPAQSHLSASPGQLPWILRKQTCGSHLHARYPDMREAPAYQPHSSPSNLHSLFCAREKWGRVTSPTLECGEPCQDKILLGHYSSTGALWAVSPTAPPTARQEGWGSVQASTVFCLHFLH